MEAEIEDHPGMTDEQWAIFKRATSGYGEQDENGIDISLLRENLKRSPTERLERLQRAHRCFVEADNGGRDRVSQNHLSAESR